MLAEVRSVTADYFATLRVPLIAGEVCRDERAGRTAMVNRRFAAAYLRGPAAVGHRLSLPDLQLDAEITGIVGDVRERGLDQDAAPTVYFCAGALQPGTFFIARTHGAPEAMAETIRRRLREVEPQRAAYGLTPLTDHLGEAYAEGRMRTLLLAFFALTAVLLACIGLYGTFSYTVQIRRRELALRLALGAVPSRLVGGVLVSGLAVAALGSAAGVLVASAFTRLLQGMLFGVSASDPATLAGAALVVLAVSAAAALRPAVRASRVDLVRVLRDQ
jgi:putative ABC transport system permease protein